eukprot:Pgem_evm1s4932
MQSIVIHVFKFVFVFLITSALAEDLDSQVEGNTYSSKNSTESEVDETGENIQNEEEDNTNNVAIIGISVAIAVVTLVLAFTLFMFWRSRKKAKAMRNGESHSAIGQSKDEVLCSPDDNL